MPRKFSGNAALHSAVSPAANSIVKPAVNSAAKPAMNPPNTAALEPPRKFGRKESVRRTGEPVGPAAPTALGNLSQR